VPDKFALLAKILVEAACAQNAMSLISRDVSWLWRTAYNCAVHGCSEWERCEGRISDLFDVSHSVGSDPAISSFALTPFQLLEAFCQASPVDVDPELYLHLVNASFSAVSGRGEAMSF